MITLKYDLEIWNFIPKPLIFNLDFVNQALEVNKDIITYLSPAAISLVPAASKISLELKMYEENRQVDVPAYDFTQESSNVKWNPKIPEDLSRSFAKISEVESKVSHDSFLHTF